MVAEISSFNIHGRDLLCCGGRVFFNVYGVFMDGLSTQFVWLLYAVGTALHRCNKKAGPPPGH